MHGAVQKRMMSDKAHAKIGKVMKEYKMGTLHHGGSGKVVTNRKTALAIAFEEARKRGLKVPKK